MTKKTDEMISKFQSIDLPSIENKVCCGILEAYRRSDFEWPFEKPIFYNNKTGELKAGGWHVKMMPSLPTSNKPDSKHCITVRLEYCPWCGAKLT